MRELLSVRPSSSLTLVPRRRKLPVLAEVRRDAEIPGLVGSQLLEPGLILGVIADIRVRDVRRDVARAKRQAVAGRQHVAQLGLALQLLPLDRRATVAGDHVGERDARVVVRVLAIQIVGDHFGSGSARPA